MPTIHTRKEGRRGCGYRKPGGTYMVSDGPGRACGRVPFPLENCPTCNHGIKLVRSWTWINIGPLLNELDPCPYVQSQDCLECPLHAIFGRVGLLTVGSKFYATPAEFMREAQRMGLSRRVPAVPKDFVLGETWVMLAHRQVIPRPCLPGRDSHVLLELGVDPGPPGNEPGKEAQCRFCKKPVSEWMGPGVFYIFRPSRVEYVVKDDDSQDKLERLEKRGLTLVRIERAEDQAKLPLVETSASADEVPTPV
jgi:hypothetical protein